MFFQKFPLVRLVLVFIIGILLGLSESIDASLILVVFVSLFLGLFLINKYYSFQLNALFGFVALLSILLLGVLRSTMHLNFDDEDQLINQDLTEVLAYEGRLLSHPERTEKSYRLNIEILGVHKKEESRGASGKVLLYTDTLTGALFSTGDILLVKGRPERVQGPTNPYAFDYKAYLANQGIYFQHYERAVYKIGYQPLAKIWRLSDQVRRKALDIFQRHIPDKAHYAIASALVLGQKSDLDTSIRDNYAGAGVMHILAVSGLHVGLIYVLFISLFNFLPYRIRRSRLLEALLSIVILVAYAVLTGLSPSVLRAVTMFIFVAFGRAMNRKTNIYNTLAASAMVLLIIDPLLIRQVGFQLSYLAVLGIVYLQPRIYRGLKVQSWLGDKLWQITAVSIAAQLATAPISIYYFEQFPTYFLLANLFMIPTAFIILSGGMGLLVFSFSPTLAVIIGKIISGIIQMVNSLVAMVNALPAAQIVDLKIDLPEVILAYLIIISMLLVFLERKAQMIYLTFALSILFSLSQWQDRMSTAKSKQLVVFDLDEYFVVHLRRGNKGAFVAEERFWKNEELFEYQVAPYLRKHHIDDQALELSIEDFKYGQILVFEGKKFLLAKQSLPKDHPLLLVDWDLCLAKSSRHIQGVKANEFVLTSSLQKAQNESMNFYSVAEKGYYSKIW